MDVQINITIQGKPYIASLVDSHPAVPSDGTCPAEPAYIEFEVFDLEGNRCMEAYRGMHLLAQIGIEDRFVKRLEEMAEEAACENPG